MRVPCSPIESVPGGQEPASVGTGCAGGGAGGGRGGGGCASVLPLSNMICRCF